MERIKVAVSPFYGGKDWVDEKTHIRFEKNPRGLNVYSIPAHLDLSGIRKAVLLNALIHVEGNIGEHNEVKEIVVDAPKQEEPKVEAPKEELKAEAPKEELKAEAPALENEKQEEVVLEAKAEEKKPAPKKAPKKKATPKK